MHWGLLKTIPKSKESHVFEGMQGRRGKSTVLLAFLSHFNLLKTSSIESCMVESSEFSLVEKVSRLLLISILFWTTRIVGDQAIPRITLLLNYSCQENLLTKWHPLCYFNKHPTLHSEDSQVKADATLLFHLWKKYKLLYQDYIWSHV